MNPRAYRIDEKAISNARNRDLEKWAGDPDCTDAQLCVDELAKREGRKQEERNGFWRSEDSREEQPNATSPESANEPPKPFDPRTEVSADAVYIARRIVKHLWIIFVLLPALVGLFYAIVTAR